MSETITTIHTDGASRGNPGPSAFAFVIAIPNRETIEEAGLMGNTTNNIAEYTGLLKALEHAEKLGLKKLHIYSDSELMVKQLRGEYRVKHPELKTLYDEAKDLIRGFSSVQFEHVRREQNSRADALCNKVLDEAEGKKPKATKTKEPTSKPSKQGKPVSDERVRDECLVCLESAAQSWAMGSPHVPSAEQLWEQIWSILEENGVLKK